MRPVDMRYFSVAPAVRAAHADYWNGRPIAERKEQVKLISDLMQRGLFPRRIIKYIEIIEQVHDGEGGFTEKITTSKFATPHKL